MELLLGPSLSQAPLPFLALCGKPRLTPPARLSSLFWREGSGDLHCHRALCVAQADGQLKGRHSLGNGTGDKAQGRGRRSSIPPPTPPLRRHISRPGTRNSSSCPHSRGDRLTPCIQSKQTSFLLVLTIRIDSRTRYEPGLSSASSTWSGVQGLPRCHSLHPERRSEMEQYSVGLAHIFR